MGNLFPILIHSMEDRETYNVSQYIGTSMLPPPPHPHFSLNIYYYHCSEQEISYYINQLKKLTYTGIDDTNNILVKAAIVHHLTRLIN